MSDVRIIIPKVRHRIEATKFLGQKILYLPEKSGGRNIKTIKGKIVKLHGRSGCFIARFRTNLPPSAITSFVYIRKTYP
jgi:ribosomal protein L35AE/L33A